MKKIFAIAAALTTALPALAIAPYPITIDSEATTAPKLELYRAGQRTIRVSFKDGGVATDVGGYTPFMTWATNRTAIGEVTSTYSVVSATNGTVDFTWTAEDLNYAEGRYLYEVGMSTGDVVTVSRQGTLIILDSPHGRGVDPTTFSSNINWSVFTYSNTDYAPALPGLNVTATTNARGQVTFNADVSQSDLDAATNDIAYLFATQIVNTADITALQTATNNLTTDLAVETAARIAADLSGTNYTDTTVDAHTNKPLTEVHGGELDPVYSAWVTNSPAGTTNAIVAGVLTDISALLGGGGGGAGITNTAGTEITHAITDGTVESSSITEVYTADAVETAIALRGGSGGITAPSKYRIPFIMGSLRSAVTNDAIGLVDGTDIDSTAADTDSTAWAFVTTDEATQETYGFSYVHVPEGCTSITNIQMLFEQSQAITEPLVVRIGGSIIGGASGSHTFTGTVSSVDAPTIVNADVSNTFLTNNLAGTMLHLRFTASFSSTNAIVPAYRGVYKWLELWQ